MIAYLQGITQQRWSWVLLLVSALFLELCAMLFQHGLGLFPCVMCVNEGLVDQIAPQAARAHGACAP